MIPAILRLILRYWLDLLPFAKSSQLPLTPRGPPVRLLSAVDRGIATRTTIFK